MSFLKKLGQAIAIAGTTAQAVGPIVAPMLGNKGEKVLSTITDLTAIGTTILQVEVMFAGKTGPEKFAAALTQIGPMIRTSGLVAGRKIADENMMQKGINGIAQGVVDVLNSLSAESVKTEIKS